MRFGKKLLSCVLVASTALSLGAVSEPLSAKAAGTEPAGTGSYQENYAGLTFDNTKWNYDQTNNVFWQIGVKYCTNGTSAMKHWASTYPGST